MSFLVSIMDHPFVQLWGWVLIHFLWQGALLTIIAGILLAATTRASAKLRYLIATGCLFAVSVAPVITWTLMESPTVIRSEMEATPPFQQSRHASGNHSELADSQTRKTELSPEQLSIQRLPKGIGTTAASVSIAATSSDSKQGRGHPFRERLSDSLPWCVVIWFVGFSVLSVRLLVATYLTSRLISAGRPLQDRYVERMKQYFGKLGLSHTVRWIESERIRVPQAIGWWKPVIMVPTSIFTKLSPTEIECLLLHEMVHLRRYDFVVNLVQCAIETLFFFHPGIHWLSRRIRLERELACDEIVVQMTGDKLTYSRALLSMADQALLPQPALAASQSDLTLRIHTILGMKRTGSIRGTILFLIVGISLSGTSFCLSQQQEPISQETAVVTAEVKTIREQDQYVIAGTCRDWENTTSGDGSQTVGNVMLTLYSGRGLQKQIALVATTRADDNGKFEFAPVEPPNNRRYDQLQYFIESSAPGWPTQYTMVWSHEDSRTQRVYLTRTMGEVKGRVVDEDGKPIAGARVMPNTVMPSSVPGFPMTTTNENGLFRLTQLPTSKKGIYLLVKHSDYLEKRVTVKPGVTRINMTVGSQLTGSVREKSTNKPVAGVSVTTRNETTFSETHAVTDSAGNFTARVPQGTYRVVVEDPNLVASAIEEVECRAGASVSLKPFLTSSGGWIVGKVVNTKTGQPMVRNERGERVGLGFFGPSRNQGRVSSPKILAEVRDDGTFRMRAAAGDNFPYFCNIRGSRMAWNTMKKPPVVVKEGAETEMILEFTPEMTPEEKIAEGRQIRDGLPKATDERVAAIIDEFRKLNHTVDKADIWCPLVQELTIIGRDAVPALCKEFDQTKQRRMMQRLAYTLRVINDPRAVPTLIRCLPKTFMTSSSDYGLIVHDPDLMEFMQANSKKGPERGGHFSFGQVQKETYAALKKLTKHEINDRGMLSMRRTDDRRSNATKEQHYHSVAKEWMTWWEANWKNFNVDVEYRHVNLPTYTPPALGSLAKGRELPQGSKVSGGLIGMVLSPVGDADRGASFFFDLDTGRSFKWPEQLPPDESPTTIELAKKWGTENGADLMCVKRTTEDGKSHYELIGLGLQLWQIHSLDAENFKQRIADGILPEGRKAVDALLHFDPQSKKYIHKRGISFVYVTAGESLGMITISDFITQVRDLTGTFSGMEPGGVGFHRGVKFNYHPVAR